VQTVLKELKENPQVPVLASSSDPTHHAHLERYTNTLATDLEEPECLLEFAGSLVIHATIEEGNSNGSFCDKNRIPVAAVPVQQKRL
jgi:hypothetical protein